MPRAGSQSEEAPRRLAPNARTWRRLGEREGLISDNVRALAASSSGVWAGTLTQDAQPPELEAVREDRRAAHRPVALPEEAVAGAADRQQAAPVFLRHSLIF